MANANTRQHQARRPQGARAQTQPQADAPPAAEQATAVNELAAQAMTDEQLQAAEPQPDPVTGLYPPGFVRKPFGTHEQKMQRTPRPGFRNYWFLDEPGRVQQAIAAGYVHVKDEQGRNVALTVNKAVGASTTVAYLMEIPLRFFEADFKAQQKAVDEIDEAILGGSINEKDGDKRYVPKRGIKYDPKRAKALSDDDND